MNTDELIDRLSRDLTVVKPLSVPGVRTVLWLAWAAMYLVAVPAVIFATRPTAGVTATPLFLLQQGAALVTGLLAARAALASVIPGASRRAWVPPAIGVTMWVASLLSAVVPDLRAFGTLAFTSERDWPCVASIAMGGIVLGLPLILMVRRGAPLTPRATAGLAGLAALSVANMEACLTRPHAIVLTVLLWHGGTIAIVAALCAMLGRRWLRWPPHESMPDAGGL